MNVLVVNPGGNSLKAEYVSRSRTQPAWEASTRIDASIEGIGKDPKLSTFQNKKALHSEPVQASDYGDAMSSLMAWMAKPSQKLPLDQIDSIGLRVVHGGADFHAPALIDASVEKKIAALETLAPLHNQSSIEVLAPLRKHLPGVPIYAVFDTAFHRTIPDHAAMYGIPPDIAQKHGIRRYGFHGISHRYLLERYAFLAGKSPSECSIVSMHLESGCSATAIRNGKSIDNTMGLTPLEGLMMGTRSGDVDPSLVALLMREAGMGIDDVMDLLNKKSGLQGVSGDSLDTRILMKKYEFEPRVRLAMDIFAYRVRKAVGAQLAALGTAEAIIFGGGIGENTPFVRKYVCDGLRGFGLCMDPAANENLIDAEGRLSTEASVLQAWVIPTQEGLQIAYECCRAMGEE